MKKNILLNLLIVILGTLAGINSAIAQTTWTGAVNTDYNESGNWTNGLPDGNDAFVGASSSFSSSANTPNLLRMNLQNTSGLFTLGHSMTMQRLDDNHATLVGNGTYGNLRIIGGGNLTLTGDSSAALLNLHGFSGRSSITIDGGSLNTTDEFKQFNLGRGAAGSHGATFTLNSGMVDIAGTVFLGDAINHSHSAINLNGGTFTYGRNFIISGASSFGPTNGGGQLNIAGAAVLGTGTDRVFNIGAGAETGQHGRLTLNSGSLTLGADTKMAIGPTGSNFAPPSQGQLAINGGSFSAPGENTTVHVFSRVGSPTSTLNGLPTASHGGLNQAGGTALIEGELRIGRGLFSGTTGGNGVYIHRGGEMTVSNSSNTGLLRVARQGELTITGGTITADEIYVDAAEGTLPAGFLQGRGGTLIGPVNVAGTLSPGLQASFPQNTATGTLNIFGELTLEDTAKTFFDFKNPLLTAGSFDSIFNNGTSTVSFDGDLILRFFGGEYQSGTVDLFANFAQYVGDFDSLTITGLTHGEIAIFNASNGTLTISAIPEPSSGLLALMVIGLIASRRRR